MRLGDIYQNFGDLPHAGEAWEEALKADPKRDDVRLEARRWIYDQLHRRAEDADRMFKQLLAAYPQSPLVHYFKALVLWERGERTRLAGRSADRRTAFADGTGRALQRTLTSQIKETFMSKTTSLPPTLSYRARQLYMEEVPLFRLLSEPGTPAYVYSRTRLLDNFHRFDDAFKAINHLTLFAMKANSNGAILSLLGKEGAGADIVSAGELFRARRAGIPSDRIVFSGVGKRPDEIRLALEAGILMFNVESIEELQAIDRVAASLHKAAPVSIRVNPDVDALTHDHITTGKKENKFGIPLAKALPIFRMAAKLPRINLMGIHAHIGSQITSTRPYTATLNKVLDLVDRLETEGIPLRYIDLGGGLGIRYKDEKPPTPKELAQELYPRLRNRDIKLLLEPGRYLVGDAGILLTRVIYRKDVGAKKFLIVDAAMNDLARPALYDAYHGVHPVHDKKGRRSRPTSSDRSAKRAIIWRAAVRSVCLNKARASWWRRRALMAM